jgi:hypothetical protein
MSEPEMHPVQTKKAHDRTPGQISAEIVLRAYEVYAAVYGPQPAMIDLAKGCRGGFTTREIVAFLYARSFPKAEWSARVDEAISGARGL